MAEDRKAIAKQYEAQIKALEKDIKKKKGAYKAAAQEKLAEVEAEYAEAVSTNRNNKHANNSCGPSAKLQQHTQF